MDPNYQPPAHLDVSKLTIRQPSPRLNPNNNDNDSAPGGHPPKLHIYSLKKNLKIKGSKPESLKCSLWKVETKRTKKD